MEEEKLCTFCTNVPLQKKYLPKHSIHTGSRKRRISDARSIVAHMAVEETGHAATDVARYLGIKQTSVLQSVKKGRILSAGIGQEA